MERSTTELLTSLTTSLESAVTTLPEDSIETIPENGISLLGVKNELLLSYLQNLVFLIILKLRNHTGLTGSEPDNASGSEHECADDVVKRLVQLRVYLDKGVRPLEARLKYQVDKVLRAADDADRSAKQKASAAGLPGSEKLRGDASRKASKTDSEDTASDAESDAADEDVNELAYRPNPSALMRPSTTSAADGATAAKSGVYKPPRIMPTALPTTTSRESRAKQKTMRSATLDEFIETELSTAPIAEPSVGTTIVAGGRRNKGAVERAAEAERREYEETNFVRLPKESKKERAKSGAAKSGRNEGYGGEDWRMLGAGADRIERLTRKKEGTGGALERSRKRAIEDSNRGSGEAIGVRFEKRRKVVMRQRKR